MDIYKSKGALQVRLIRPTTRNGILERKGAILLEAAPGKGEKTWDWENKITFALGITDIAELMDMTKDNVRLFHLNKETPKTLEIKEGQGKYTGTYNFFFGEDTGSDRKSVMVPLSNGEYNLFMRLLVAASPKIIGWN